MRKFLLLALLFVVPTMAKYVAVLETVADNKELMPLSDRQYMTNVLREQAVKVLPAEQNFTIMTRENISAMLPPGKSLEDCEGSCLAETGKNIAADFVAQARVGSFGGSLTLTAEIYETASNKLVASFNGQGADANELLAIIKEQGPAFFKRVRGNTTGFADFTVGADYEFQNQQKFIVEILTTPAGATPTVDGKALTKCLKTPCKVTLDGGEHRLVASLDHYDDVETVVNIKENSQQILLNLNPAFGYMELRPRLISNVGSLRSLQMKVDGAPVDMGKIELDQGAHQVEINHPCYDPVSFKVMVAKQKSETYNEQLIRGEGGFTLSAERDGEPQSVAVYVNGKEVGRTPYSAKVPLCSDIEVDNYGTREKVKVDLKWHESVEVTHQLKSEKDVVATKADVAYGELDGNKVVEDNNSIPANVNQESNGIAWIPVGISAAVMVTGAVLTVVGNKMAKDAYDKGFDSKKEYKQNKDDAHQGQVIRTVGIVTAIVGAIGLGISFAF